MNQRDNSISDRVTHVTGLLIIAVTRARTLYIGEPVTCVTDPLLLLKIPMRGSKNEADRT